MVLVQDAIGLKLGNVIEAFSTLLSGFLLGFVQGWKLTLVIASLAPLVIFLNNIALNNL